MSDFAEFDTKQERQFQSWLNTIGVDTQDWFKEESLTEEQLMEALSQTDQFTDMLHLKVRI